MNTLVGTFISMKLYHRIIQLKPSILYGILNAIVGFIVGVDVYFDAIGDGYSIFILAAPLAIFVTATFIWHIAMKDEEISLGYVILAGIVVGTISHYFTWLFVSILMNLCYWFTGGCTDSFDEPPVSILTMLGAGFLYSFFSLLFYGWITISGSVLCGLLLMYIMKGNKKQPDISKNGFAIINAIYSDEEVRKILEVIEEADSDKETFRRSEGLFAIRQFLKEVPGTIPLIFNEKLQQVIHEFFGTDYFVVKSIYFDKPPGSNWYVAYHQDLTISVDRKAELPGFGPWTVKQHQFAVQPPLPVLENIFTIRIHLDDTDEQNGALKVIPGSHQKQIYRPETIDWNIETETSCSVPKGGIMIMKPLLLHSSSRTTNNQKRRVIHIEFSNRELPGEIQWAERLKVL
jgi:hypothetical protein